MPEALTEVEKAQLAAATQTASTLAHQTATTFNWALHEATMRIGHSIALMGQSTVASDFLDREERLRSLEALRKHADWFATRLPAATAASPSDLLTRLWGDFTKSGVFGNSSADKAKSAGPSKDAEATGMSAKARGKQRAISPQVESEPPVQPKKSREVLKIDDDEEDERPKRRVVCKIEDEDEDEE
ncbi:unnamed protein product [Parajaminaea phylloscopi]